MEIKDIKIGEMFFYNQLYVKIDKGILTSPYSYTDYGVGLNLETSIVTTLQNEIVVQPVEAEIRIL